MEGTFTSKIKTSNEGGREGGKEGGREGRGKGGGVTHLVILVGSDGGELCAREDKGVDLVPVEVVYVTGLSHVQPRVVAVHGVDYDLRRGGGGAESHLVGREGSRRGWGGVKQGVI